MRVGSYANLARTSGPGPAAAGGMGPRVPGGRVKGSEGGPGAEPPGGLMGQFVPAAESTPAVRFDWARLPRRNDGTIAAVLIAARARNVFWSPSANRIRSAAGIVAGFPDVRMCVTRP